MSGSDESDDAVGYGRPPKATRFRKGHSGNPKGRPKGARGVTASLRRELETKVTVRENGRETRISKAEALAKRFVEKALKGDTAAIRMLLVMDHDLSTAGVAAEREDCTAAGPPTQTDREILAHFARQCAAARDEDEGEEAER